MQPLPQNCDCGRIPNLSPELWGKMISIVGDKATPENILDYVYGVLHNPNYREKYAEFLKTDFPRIPWPTDVVEFESFVKIGQRLRELHLLEAQDIDKHNISFPAVGSDTVEKPFYDGNQKRVYINPTQYFEPVNLQAWEAFIGGYQPAQKWLKDRRKSKLDQEDIAHYCKIIFVLNETKNIQKHSYGK